jgi:hypothetical protein
VLAWDGERVVDVYETSVNDARILDHSIELARHNHNEPRRIPQRHLGRTRPLLLRCGQPVGLESLQLDRTDSGASRPSRTWKLEGSF